MVLTSIIMTYCDRLEQLNNTLRSFEFHKYSDIEVIIVDDGSKIEPISEKMFSSFTFPIYVINMPIKKVYYNPSVPFNVGFSKCKGEKIIIQNAECLHLENILEHASKNLDDSNYLTYTCFSLSKEHTFSLSNKNVMILYDFLNNLIMKDLNILEKQNQNWKNHIKYRPNSLHFTSAITKKNLLELGGFDERYANGTSYDDDEFLTRIIRKGLNVKIVENIKSVHQWHTNTENYKRLFSYYLRSKNYILFKFVTKNEQHINPSNKSFLFFLYKITLPITVSINILFIHIRLFKNKLK